MPHEPGNSQWPKPIDVEKLALGTDQPGWQRWWLVRDPSGTGIVGHVNLLGDRLPTALHRCELGIGIERDYRGRGLGRRLMNQALDFARNSPSLHWVDLKVFAHNTRAIDLYTRLGFVEVGRVPDRFRIEGLAVDDVIMVLDVN